MNDKLEDLIKYRIEQADESLQSAELLFINEKYRPAINRAYYTMFYAVLALLVTGNNTVSKHSGVISIFDREYVKGGVFGTEMSKWLHESFDLRQRADYTEMFGVTRERAEELIQHADIFLAEIKKHLSVL